jgi:cytochrome P450
MMESSGFFLLLPTAALILYFLFTKVGSFRRQRHFSQNHACLPIPKASQLDPFLGLDQFVRLGKAASEQRYLEFWQKQMFDKFGNTFRINLMGQTLVFTNEPQNIQAVLVTKFPDFEIGQRRRDNSAQLLGVGLFNADGGVWEHARATIRPNLTRKQVSDLELFEKHTRVWMNGLPTNGELTDMQEWAFRFVSLNQHNQRSN